MNYILYKIIVITSNLHVSLVSGNSNILEKKQTPAVDKILSSKVPFVYLFTMDVLPTPL